MESQDKKLLVRISAHSIVGTAKQMQYAIFTAKDKVRMLEENTLALPQEMESISNNELDSYLEVRSKLIYKSTELHDMLESDMTYITNVRATMEELYDNFILNSDEYAYDLAYESKSIIDSIEKETNIFTLSDMVDEIINLNEKLIEISEFLDSVAIREKLQIETTIKENEMLIKDVVAMSLILNVAPDLLHEIGNVLDINA